MRCKSRVTVGLPYLCITRIRCSDIRVLSHAVITFLQFPDFSLESIPNLESKESNLSTPSTSDQKGQKFLRMAGSKMCRLVGHALLLCPFSQSCAVSTPGHLHSTKILSCPWGRDPWGTPEFVKSSVLRAAIIY